MRSTFVVALSLCCSLLTGPSFARCTADTISAGGFEVVAGASLAGLVAGVQAGSVELFDRRGVIVSAELVEGSFTLTPPPTAAELPLALRVRGLAANAQDFIELVADVGTLAELVAESDADGITRVGRVPALGVSAESTARYVMLREAAGGGRAPANGCELPQRHAALDGDEVLRRSAVIQILIRDGAVSGKLAGGAALTTLGVISDPATLASTVTRIENAQPGRIDALVQRMAQPFCQMFEQELLLTSESRLTGTVMNTSVGQILSPGSSALEGEHVDAAGKDGYQLQCAADTASLALDGTRVGLSFPIRSVDGVLLQRVAESTVQSKRLHRISTDEEKLVLADYTVYRLRFPSDPLPDEIETSESRQVLVDGPTGPLYDEASLPGEYVLPSSEDVNDFAANRVRLDVGGGGEDLDRALPLSWRVAADGSLELEFLDALSAPNRSVRLIPLREEAPGVIDGLSLVTRADGARTVKQSLSIRQGLLNGWLDDSQIPADYQQVAGRTGNATSFLWRLHPDRRAEGITRTGGQTSVTYVGAFVYHWSRPEPGTLVMRWCVNNGAEFALLDREPLIGECPTTYRRREWQLLQVAGDLFYVRETQSSWSELDPASGAAPNHRSSFDRGYFYRRGSF